MTPLVRKLAAEHGVDLGALTGTGVGGRIRKQDVLDAAEKAEGRQGARHAAAAPAAAAPAAARRPEGRSRARCAAAPRRCPGCAQVIAKRMVESLQISAQLTTVVEVDVTRIAKLRDAGQGRLRRHATA